MSTGTTQSTQTRQKSIRRRVPFLENLSAGARAAYEQELLDQAALFRQIAAAKNGVTGPITRNLVETLDPSESSSSVVSQVTETMQNVVPAVSNVMSKGWLSKYWPLLLLILSAIGTLLSYFWPNITGSVTPAPKPPAAVGTVIDNDAALVQWLQAQGGGPEQTDLGLAMRKAMQIDPAFRDKILQMTKETLDKGK